MKSIKRILILIIAAWLGTVVYGRFKAVENVVEQSGVTEPAKKKRPSLGEGFSGGPGNQFGGGIGPVGNPYSNDNYSKPRYRKYNP